MNALVEHKPIHKVVRETRLLNGMRTGITVAAVTAVWHAGWLVLVATNTAQHVSDALFRLHFIEPPYLVSPFHLDIALTLLVISSFGGFLIGYLFALIWNSLFLRKRRIHSHKHLKK
ncbi:MAG: hypothetical protein C0507_21465 [Cyanobacteria bacterium PR.3.49]|nr:hypothetical protein [Cyanobacteria bacterium PR.3.49]